MNELVPRARFSYRILTCPRLNLISAHVYVSEKCEFHGFECYFYKVKGVIMAGVFLHQGELSDSCYQLDDNGYRYGDAST